MPISSATLATTAKQDTGNTSVASIDTKLPSGLTVTSNRLLVSLPAGGTGLTDTELRATAVPVSGTVTANIGTVATLATAAKQDTIIGHVDGIEGILTTMDADTGSLDAKTPALGQALAAASVPVVLTAAQVSTLTPPAAISGFATAARQDTGNTSVGSIDTKLPAQGQALAAASLPVVLTAAQVTTLTPPAAITGFATSALQLANNHNVVVTAAPTTAVTGTFFQATQPVSGTVSVTGVATLAEQQTQTTALQLIDDAVATLGTTLYTEASTKGNIIGVVRRDANTTLVDTTNEVAPLQVNATGELKVAQIQALPAGNNNIGDVDIVSGTVTTVSTVTNLSQMGGVAISLNTGVRDTGTQRVTIATNDLVPVNIASGGVASGAIASGAVASGAVASGAFASGSIASGALASGSIAAGAIAAGATSIAANEDDASADLDRGVKILARRTATPANTSGTDLDYEMIQISAGRLWTSATIDAALPTGANVIGALSANQSTNVAQINGVAVTMGNGVAGTGVQRVTIANDSTGILAGVTTVTTLTGASVAHDGVDSGNPHKVGGRAVNVDITAVANNDRTDAVFTLTGKQIVQLYCPPETIVRGVTAAMTGTTTTSVIPAPAAGLRNYITSITVGNSHATVGTFVNMQDGSGGTTIWTIPAAAVFGGGIISFSPPLRQPTTATALFCACVTTGTNTIVAANGYTAV